MQNLPEWVQALVKIGVPGGIAVFLVWRLAGGFDVVDARMKAIEAQHAEMSLSAGRMETTLNRSRESGDRVLLVLRQICVQNASTNAEKRDCLQ